MIYLDSSVLLAAVLAEDRVPPAEFWQATLVSSRLLHYEVINRLNAYAADAEQTAAAGDLIAGLVLVELSPVILARALDPFPIPVRTLDALHLATAHYLAEAARQLGLDVTEPG